MNNNNKTNDIMVTIRCAAYNHEPYIRQCLDGFVIQKTDFKFEAIVHDDASTDMTADIIRKYAAKYPDIIKPIYETENQYSKHDGSLTRIFNEHTRGKYIAICEGDDYWTDPLKLQKQVDFLESHPDYVICSHRHKTFIQKKQKFREETLKGEADYNLNTLINGESHFQTLTILYRQSALNIEEYEKHKVRIDIVLLYELLKNGGKGHCLAEAMGVYRYHSGGIWSEVPLEKRWDMEFAAILDVYNCEKSDDAALFLLMKLAKPISRKWMWKRRKMWIRISQIFYKHFGFTKTFFILTQKIILNKYLSKQTSC